MAELTSEDKIINAMCEFRREQCGTFYKAMCSGRSVKIAIAIIAIAMSAAMPLLYCSIVLSLFVSVTICVMLHPLIVNKYLKPRLRYTNSYMLIKSRYPAIESTLSVCMDRKGNLKCTKREFMKRLAAIGIQSIDDMPAYEPSICRTYSK